MRSTVDAVRSVKRYVAQVLEAAPAPLAEVRWLPDPGDPTSELRWSPGIVQGARWVSEDQWAELLSLPRHLKIDRREVAGVYRSARLAEDPAAALAAAGMPLAADVIEEDGLGEPRPWEVRFEHDRGEFTYPLAVVKAVGPTLTMPGTALWMELVQPIVVVAYPTPPDAAVGDAGAAQLKAEATRDLLIEGFRSGVELARPLRIPLYDYDGVGLEQGTRQRQPNDFLRVNDASVNLLPEPEEPRQVAVVCELRVSWRRDTRDLRGDKVVGEVALSTDLL